ncbi:MAG: CpaE family protein [Kiloniellaceae bacterium]
MTPTRHMNVVAVLRSNEAGTALSEACTGINGTKIDVHVGKLKDVRPGIDIFADNPDVLLLDVDPRDAEEVEHLGRIVQTHFPKTPVVATAAEITLQDVRQLMRLGVVDFVPQPISRADLLTALDHAAARMRQVRASEPAKEGGKVISFIKSGGGVGATTLAVQAACSLAARAREGDPGVCLLDFDIQFGTAALYLDLDDRVGFADLVESPDRLDGELLRSVMAEHGSGLEVLAAPRDVVPLESMTPELLRRCLRLARAEYGVVFLDLPEAWNAWTYKALASSDLIVLVTQLSVAGIRQARRQLDTMRAHGLEEAPVKIALNRFEKGWGRSVRVKEAQKALGRDIDYFVVNDYKTVSEALNQGVSLSAIKKRSKVEMSIQKMIDDSVKAVSGDRDRLEPRLV